jgi:hypothetical protein
VGGEKTVTEADDRKNYMTLSDGWGGGVALLKP